MLALSILAMFSLAGTMYLVSRDAVFPPVIYAGTWFLSLLGLWLSEELLFYRISEDSLLIFIIGALAFSLGGLIGHYLYRGQFLSSTNNRVHIDDHPSTLLALYFFIVLLAGALPFYWLEVMAGTEEVALSAALQDLRSRAVMDEPGPRSLDPLRNLPVIAFLVAIAMYYESTKRRVSHSWAAVAVVVALVYGSITGTKGDAVVLLLTLMFLSWLESNKPPILLTALLLVAGITTFGVGLVYVNFAYVQFQGPSEVFAILRETFFNYWVGGLVAFDQALGRLHEMESNHHISRFFLETARSFGLSVDVPSIHAEYTMISPTASTNTYTIFFSYYKDLGWNGLVIAMFLLGFVLTLLLRWARTRSPVGTLLFAMLATAIVRSFQAEQFLLGLNGYIKALIFYVLCYNVLPSVIAGIRLTTPRDA